MKSLWAQYVEELLGGQRKFIECEWGFASYSFPIMHPPTSIMIHDMFILPEYRKQGRGGDLFNKVCEIGKENGKTNVLAEVELASEVALESLKAQLAVGLVPIAAENGKILTRKVLT